MNDLRKCDQLDDISFCKSSNTDFLVEQQELLRWSSSRQDIFQRVEERKFDLPVGRIFSFNVEGFSEPLGRRFLCTGRDFDRVVAASKAIGEVLERITANQILSENEMVSSHSVEISSRGGTKILAAPCRALPSQGIHSSNGWAVHFDKATAIKKAISEALERHILLLTFLKSGWNGFTYSPSDSFDDVRFASLLSQYEVAGYRAGIAVASVDSYPGFVMGYCSDESSAFQRSSRWVQGMFEAFEAAIYYRSCPNSENSWATKYDQELLGQYQSYYLRLPSPDWASLQDTKDYQSLRETIQANLLVLDISKHFGTGCPIFAAYVFGGELIPMFFKQRLSEGECKVILDLLQGYGIARDLPDFHPVI